MTHHPLKSFMKTTGMTEAAFGKLIGCSSNYVSQIICGYRHPSREFAKAIEKATNGLVKAGDILMWEAPKKDPPKGWYR